jgi:precorrin-3B methylase
MGRIKGFGNHKGLLTLVGTGIKAVSHMTVEARLAIENADKVHYLVADAVTAHWLKGHNKTAESLSRFYIKRRSRMVTYGQMVDHIMRSVILGKEVCVAFYGHPGVFSFPAHEALRRATAAGYRAQMLPGISAENCLIADLGHDPGSSGCQSFEASDFLVNRRQYDDTSLLILWQIGLIGESAMPTKDCNRHGLRILMDRLCGHYSPSHKVTIYEAPTHMLSHAKIVTCQLKELCKAPVTAISTLCVPPNPSRPPDEGLYRRLFGSHSGRGK